jgi:hypothetical protein
MIVDSSLLKKRDLYLKRLNTVAFEYKKTTNLRLFWKEIIIGTAHFSESEHQCKQ